jgi:hypothetical protein
MQLNRVSTFSRPHQQPQLLDWASAMCHLKNEKTSGQDKVSLDGQYLVIGGKGGK